MQQCISHSWRLLFQQFMELSVFATVELKVLRKFLSAATNIFNKERGAFNNCFSRGKCGYRYRVGLEVNGSHYQVTRFT